MGLKANVPFWQVASVPNPAAGADAIMPNPGDFVSRTLCATFTLTTSAVVANRGVTIEVSDGTTTFFRSGASFVQAASTVRNYGLIASGADFGDAGTIFHIPIPTNGLIILPGFQARTRVVNIQAGDQISAIGSLFEVFPNGPDFEWTPGSEARLWERS